MTNRKDKGEKEEKKSPVAAWYLIHTLYLKCTNLQKDMQSPKYVVVKVMVFVNAVQRILESVLNKPLLLKG